MMNENVELFFIQKDRNREQKMIGKRERNKERKRKEREKLDRIKS